MPETYRIVIADDHDVLRKGLRTILAQRPEFQIVGEAGDGAELIKLIDGGIVPDALILDLSMPIISGIEALRRIRQMDFAFKVLVLTMHKEPDLLCRSFSVGADGYMLKDGMAKELATALHTLLEDKIYLSPFMATDLPDTCQVKALAGRTSSSAIEHCGRDLSGLI